jgi:hypothetical protein
MATSPDCSRPALAPGVTTNPAGGFLGTGITPMIADHDSVPTRPAVEDTPYRFAFVHMALPDRERPPRPRANWCRPCCVQLRLTG